MARVRKFDEPGAKEDRIRWNKTGTRKWLTVYTVMEYHPKSEAKASEPKKAKASKPKKASKSKKTAKPKKASKPKTAKPKPAKPKKVDVQRNSTIP